MKRLLGLLAISVVSTSAVQAATMTLDFQSAVVVADELEPERIYSVHDSGYTFSFAGHPDGGALGSGLSDPFLAGTSPGDLMLEICTDGVGGNCINGANASATMTADSGNNFDLLSLDVGGIRFWESEDFIMTGFSDTHGALEISLGEHLAWFNNVEVVFGPAGNANYTLILGSEWTDLAWVRFEADIANAQIDNLVVSQVPVPAAVWLFASALAGLGFSRGRKSA